MAKQETLRVTRSLQETLKKNPLIKEVHFDEDGNYFFNKYTVKIHTTNDMNQVVNVGEKESLPGARRAVVMEKKTLNGIPTYKPAMRNVEYRPISASFSREDILKATPTPDKKTEQEKLEILRQASEIAKESDFESLLSKLKK
jgi:hypothetical protein